MGERKRHGILRHAVRCTGYCRGFRVNDVPGVARLIIFGRASGFKCDPHPGGHIIFVDLWQNRIPDIVGDPATYHRVIMGRLTAPLLGQLLPAFAAELESALLRDQETTLAEQIINLPIKGPCRCGDNSCSGFFTAQRPQTLWRTGRKVVTPAMSQGLVILEISDGMIMFVGVLECEALREALTRAFPNEP